MGPPRNHDEGWFTDIYATLYPYLVNYGRRRLGDADAAAELAQEVFVVAWRRRDEVPEHCLPWLYGVARRLLANHWRGQHGGPGLLPLEAWQAHGPGSDTGIGIADIRAALAGLSELDQEILRLVGWEELTVAEAAVVLDCGRATAAVRLHRARKRLAAALSRQDESSAARPRQKENGVALSHQDTNPPVLARTQRIQ